MNIETIANELKKEVKERGHIHVDLRKKRLLNLKKTIQKHEVMIGKALRSDLGKSAFESYATEVGIILEEISFILKHLDSWAGVKKVKTPMSMFPGKSYIRPEAYGVALIISPWNYPFQLALSPFIGAFAAGNRVVIKPSEFSPETSKVIKLILSEVFEKHEVVVIEGAQEETQILLKQKFDYIFFTGSTPVGKIIMRAAAENLTPVTLELGGKSPCIIDGSANIDVAAKRVAWGKFLNAGQTCVAPDYVLVPRKLQSEFIEKLSIHLKSFFGEDPAQSEDFPRIVNERHFDRLAELLIPEKIALGGELDKNAKYISPTIMKDVEWTDKVMEDEIFGPILPVIPYEDQDGAIDEILERPKPLAFYVFSEDYKKATKIVESIPFGGGCINDTVIHLANPNLPFGGVGKSGIGSYHGKKSFDTFTHYKSVYEQGTKVDIPLRYPPYEGKLNFLKLFIR